jgi:hypothetical protein
MNVIFDIVLIVFAWIGATVTFLYLTDEIVMRHRQKKMYNALRYTRTHRKE